MKSCSTYDDGTLVSMLRRGDESAFTELYNRYWERMVTVAFAKLGSAADARDLVQEIFFELWQRREHVRPDAFAAWIAGAVKYKVLTVLGKQHQTAQRMEGLAVPEADHATEEYLSYADLKAQIEAHVQELPEKCQLVYRLSREQQLSLPEIAEELDISQKTAEAHLTKALKHLRGSLKIFSCFI